MTILHISAAQRTPELYFNFETNTFLLRGESYPEDVKDFYGPPIMQLEAHLEGLEGAQVRFTFEFVYLNSSTARVVMNLFDLLDSTAERGNAVTINWAFEPDDDNMEELGEEFGEDLEHATFTLLPR